MKVTDIIHKISNVIVDGGIRNLPTSAIGICGLASISILCVLLNERTGIEAEIAVNTICEYRNMYAIRHIVLGNYMIYHDKALDQAEIDAALEEYEYLEI